VEKFQPFSPLHALAARGYRPTWGDWRIAWVAAAVIFALVAGAMASLMLPWRFAGTK